MPAGAGRGPFEPCADGWVRQLRSIPDECRKGVGGDDVAVGVDGQIDDDGSAVPASPSDVRSVDSRFRQHRKHFGGRVDGRGVL